MRIGYKDFWFDPEINKENIKENIQKLFSKIFTIFPRKFQIGLKIKDTGFVYERAIVKISQTKLEKKLLTVLEKEQKANLSFRRLSLKDIFEQEEIIEYTPEKGWDEPEDEKCDLYIQI